MEFCKVDAAYGTCSSSLYSLFAVCRYRNLALGTCTPTVCSVAPARTVRSRLIGGSREAKGVLVQTLLALSSRLDVGCGKPHHTAKTLTWRPPVPPDRCGQLTRGSCLVKCDGLSIEVCSVSF